MRQVNCWQVLAEAAAQVDRIDFAVLSEEAQLQVTDDVLTGMMRFITDKYNSLDFSQIEKSAGDINKFKYLGMLRENTKMLTTVYSNSPDPGAKKYVEVTRAIDNILDHLEDHRMLYIAQYQAGNGLVQLLYTSMVAGCIYAVGILVSNTIRFVTTEQDTDCQVLFDEIPGTIKHVHIANVMSANASLPQIRELLGSYAKASRGGRAQNEAVSTVVIGAAIAAGVIMLIPKIIVLIREIIYSIYFHRVKLADMLSMQIELVNTNIESLEAGRGSKKIIARQKKIVEKLERWKSRVALKSDTVNSAVLMQKRKENDALRIEKNSPIVQSPTTFSVSDLMI